MSVPDPPPGDPLEDAPTHRDSSWGDTEAAALFGQAARSHAIGPGDQLGDYQLESELGRGGMGVVYRAVDLRLGRQVALKLQTVSDPELGRRFAREARALAQLDDPHIVGIHEVGVAEGHAFYAMELVPGQSLGDRLRADATLPGDEVARIGRQVAHALDAVHRIGLVHRDVKPDNILLRDVEPGPQAVLTDFGLVRVGEASELTRSGQIMGTPAYMAPEQIQQGQEVGPLTDVYALGAVLYRALAGRVPFADPEVMRLMLRICEEEPPSLALLAPAAPRELTWIVGRAMERAPERRYPSAAELALDLGRFLNHEPVRARPPTLRYRLRKHLRRHPGRYVLAGLALAVSLILGWFLYGPTRLVLDVDPAGAQIRVDGRDVGPRSGLFLWPPGPHRIEARSPGRLPRAIEIDAHPGRNQTVTLRLPPDRGTLTVEVEPASTVLALSRPGQPPTRLTGSAAARSLPVGIYVVRASAPGYWPLTTAIRIQPGELSRLPPIRLRPRTGLLSASVGGPARLSMVWLDHATDPVDPRTGRGPLQPAAPAQPPTTELALPLDRHELRAGRYRMVVQAPGQPRLQQVVRIEPAPPVADQQRALEAELTTGGQRPRTVRPHRWGFEIDTGDGTRWFDLRRRPGHQVCLWHLSPRERWRIGGDRLAAPALGDLDQDGVLDCVVGSRDGTVMAVSGADRRTLWRVGLGAAIQAAPTLADLDRDGVLDALVPAMDGELHALSGRDGATIWRARTGADALAAVEVADLDGDGTADVVLNAGDGFVALDGRSGRRRWRRKGAVWLETGARVVTTPAGPLCVLAFEFGTVALVTGAGEERWRVRFKTRLMGTPAVGRLDDDALPDIVVGTTGGELLALSGADGRTLWRFRVGVPIRMRPALADLDGDGRLDCLVGGDDGHLRAVAGDGSRLLWQRATATEVWTDLALADVSGDGRPDVVFRDGRAVRVLEGRSGASLLLLPPSGAEYLPLVADVDGDGRLDCVHGDAPLRADSLALGPPHGWRFALKAVGRLCRRTVDLDGDGAEDLLAGSADHRLAALSGRSGQPLWIVDPGAAIETAPLLVGEPASTAVVGAGRRLLARVAASGAPRWQCPLGAPLATELVVARTAGATPRVIAATRDRILRAVDATDGRTLWRRTLPELPFGLTAADVDGDGVDELAVVLRGRRLQLLSGRDGALVWTWTAPSVLDNSPAAAADLDRDGHPDLVVGTLGAGALYALSGRRGTPLWRYQPTTRVRRGLGRPGGHDLDGDGTADVLAIGQDQHLHAVSGRDGRALWRLDTGASLWQGVHVTTLPGIAGRVVLCGLARGPRRRLGIASAASGRLLGSLALDPGYQRPTTVSLGGTQVAIVCAGAAIRGLPTPSWPPPPASARVGRGTTAARVVLDRPAVRALLGRATRGEHHGARAAALALLERTPAPDPALRGRLCSVLARAEAALGRPEVARTRLRQAIAQLPGRAADRRALARLSTDPVAAATALARAFLLDPVGSWSALDSGRGDRDALARAAALLSAADERLTAALPLPPADPLATRRPFAAALCLLAAGQPTDAARRLGGLIERHPRALRYRRFRGLARLRAGDPTGALADWTAAGQLAGSFPERVRWIQAARAAKRR